MTLSENLRSKLKTAGLRVTPQRMAIYQALCESREHPTGAMLYEQVRRQYPDVALGTIYSTLDCFAEAGMVNALGALGDNQIHYDGNTVPHAHLGCLSCQKIMDIESRFIEQVRTRVQESTGYVLFGFCFMYYGLCPECQKLNQLNI